MENKIGKTNFLTTVIIVLLVLSIGLNLGGLYVRKNTQDDFVTEFKNINTDGSFVVTKEGIKKTFSESNTVRKFIWYTDPFCGDCIRTHQNTKEAISKEISEGKLEIEFHPLNYLSHRSKNDYSVSVASYMIGIAEFEPTKIIPFMDAVYNKDFRNNLKEKTQEEVFSAIQDLAKSVNVSAGTIKKINHNYFVLEGVINKTSVNIRRYDKWKELSPKEDQTFFVPFIYNKAGGKALFGEEEDTKKFVTDYLTGLIKCETECE